MPLKILGSVSYGPTRFLCVTLINVEYRGKNKRIQVSMVALSCIQICVQQLFSYNMESQNSRDSNNKSEVSPCYELQRLNHLASPITCLTQRNSSGNTKKCNNSFTNTYLFMNTSSTKCISTSIQYIQSHIEAYAHKARHENHCKANELFRCNGKA